MTDNNLTASCLRCGDRHPARYSHESRFQGEGPIYAVFCPVDDYVLVGYFTREGLADW